jgi:Cell division cycle-associated protein 8
METPAKYGNNGSSSSSSNGNGNGNGAHMVMATPGTAARLARRGETLLSIHGSPLLVAPERSDAGGSSSSSSAAAAAAAAAHQPLNAEGAVGLLERGVATLAGDDVVSTSLSGITSSNKL